MDEKLWDVNYIDLKNGEKIAYRERESESSEILIFLHGGGSSSLIFRKLSIKLSYKFKIYALDLRGFGHSTYNSSITSFFDIADDIDLFLNEKAISKCSLLGVSMGGAIAMSFGIKYPEKLDKLYLLAPLGCRGYPFFSSDKKRLVSREDLKTNEGLAMILKAFAEKDRNMMRGFMLATTFVNEKPEDMWLDLLIEESLMQKNLLDVMHIMNSYNYSDEPQGHISGDGNIHKIRSRVLIIHGEDDLVVPLKESEYTSQLLGNLASLNILKNCGHAVFFDQEELVVKLINQF